MDSISLLLISLGAALLFDRGKKSSTRFAPRYPGSHACTSYAWISPEGEIHLIRASGHREWAADWVSDNPDRDLCPHYPMKTLLELGWVKTSSAFMHEIEDLDAITPEAMRAAAKITAACMMDSTKLGMSAEQEEVELWTEDASGLDGYCVYRYSLPDFVRHYGGYELEEQVYEALLEG